MQKTETTEILNIRTANPAAMGRVLVMDDILLIRLAVSQILNYYGYNALAVKNGEEAVEAYTSAMASGAPFDIVILDLHIPGGMGGRETIARLLDIDPDVKAILCTASILDPVMTNFREYGFKQVLPKPFTMEEIGSTLNRLISSRSSF